MTTPSGQAWCRVPSVAAVASEGRVALVRLAAPEQAPVILEGSAAAIWSSLEGPSTTDEVVVRVAAQFDVDAMEIQAQVAGFLSRLEHQGLVTGAS